MRYLLYVKTAQDTCIRKCITYTVQYNVGSCRVHSDYVGVVCASLRACLPSLLLSLPEELQVKTAVSGELSVKNRKNFLLIAFFLRVGNLPDIFSK